MFDIGWTELLLIAVVAIVVVGPKDLPRLLRTVGNIVGKVRRMSGDFQRQFNAALKEAEREVDLADAKTAMTDASKSLADVRQSMVSSMRPTTPTKIGATGEVAKPAVPGPTAPPTPVTPASMAAAAAAANAALRPGANAAPAGAVDAPSGDSATTGPDAEPVAVLAPEPAKSGAAAAPAEEAQR